MMPMAIVASRHVWRHVRLAQGHGFAVIRVAVVGEAVLVALTTAAVAQRFEMVAGRALNLVRRVTISADGRARIPLGHQLSVNALVVDLFDLDVALATR